MKKGKLSTVGLINSSNRWNGVVEYTGGGSTKALNFILKRHVWKLGSALSGGN